MAPVDPVVALVQALHMASRAAAHEAVQQQPPPEINLTITLPPLDVHVSNDVNPTPVQVHNDVRPAGAAVHNHVAPAAVQVGRPPTVNVKVPTTGTPKAITFERDMNGRITGATVRDSG